MAAGNGMENATTPPRVLVVDDEPAIRELAQQALEDAGYEVVAVGSAAEALRALEAESEFVALVTDINLGPPPKGWDVAVRAREGHPGMAVVYMTGDSAEEWSAHGVPQSVIVTKPFAPAQIAVGVTTLLNKADGA